MFPSKIYKDRRSDLKKKLSNGIVLFPGNFEAPYNYPSNTYRFRQDSNFLYFFGLNISNLFGVIDIDNNTDYLFGNDFSLDDIIWMGKQPSVIDLGAKIDIDKTGNLNELKSFIEKSIKSGQKIHILPTYRSETKAWLADLLAINYTEVEQYISEELIKGIVELRSIKSEIEVEEIEKAIDTAWLMHTTAMKMAKPGAWEQEITGVIEGIAISGGGNTSFPIILSTNGETLHNHKHNNYLKEGEMMLTDAGCETAMNYCSDITRTVPVGGVFDSRQKEIYEIVLKANTTVIENCKPNVFYKDMHLLAAKTIAEGLKSVGIMKGDVDQAVQAGAHALFMPHGLGHMMGLDVHDMEGLGENYVGYDDEVQRSDQFGLAFLRLGRRLKEGFVITNEPGLYFIPSLIDKWKAENKFTEFINYNKLGSYYDFGGIRLEDDLLITGSGCRVLGKSIPKTIKDVESIMKG